jgi:hypothetical protein
MEFGHMKRIVLLVCGLLLIVANTAEARRHRWSNNRTNYQPAAVAPAQNAQAAAPSADDADEDDEIASSEETTASESSSAAEVKTVSYSTATAQGVANIMASRNYVGHFGGNPGYEGCGCGATPEAAYAICCYANSGMATVDVGYAQAKNGMWYCCRRYR